MATGTRSKMLISGVSFLAVIAFLVAAAIVGSSTSGNAEGAYDQRLSELETRVAVLEAEVGISGETSQTNQTSQTSQQSNVSTSSSQSSVSTSINQTGDTYSASFTASGDSLVPFEIDSAGTYDLIANASSPFTLRVETKDGEPVQDFVLESNEAGTLTSSAHLEPGEYVLDVSTDSQWNVTLTSFGD